MFTAQQLQDLTKKDFGITTTPDGRYALYKFDRGDKIEIRLEEEFKREGNNTIGYMETILRFFIRKEDDLLDTLYRLLRNCLLIESELKDLECHLMSSRSIDVFGNEQVFREIWWLPVERIK